MTQQKEKKYQTPGKTPTLPFQKKHKRKRHHMQSWLIRNTKRGDTIEYECQQTNISIRDDIKNNNPKICF